ncbi:undecaprenyldiphospho-muramoylpentapeptide beta-N-acetylglucosaminyltransferase [Cohnella faecalis]|uniref:UDP-N-acetylglucosamine--N-acetylmuramyl-(pentapeptide) pyrophosphoryl-undecaprenol N-acetylglucosamine transferase n=2 Tax=Cohnella faecalis TaxID=2315694 RepID=A0A398CYF0_9BACL|nr:undecaprenyldiphospho-muramoylpentapeptide beta-N-acetylglucosaminyltransferase [Cohnella faecalis]RIE04261.1 undecaprenyldiphospho-muramoylpentapeptide beta-N-acetylglucosaminyltransferase [Cohnella faecalis]RIE05461.1 undecaprenyldiphospho-muramoylpentapeptide beta-N-acetylglucosaminyltransferase [Cohnella faecalis]
MRVVLTGGGTGGHIYPALAIGRDIKEREPDSSFLYIGALRGLESRIVPQQGIPFEAIHITGFRRSLSFENVRTVMRFWQGVRRSKALLKKFKPDVVVGTGGYVCGPVVYAAAKLGIPTVIHEQNVVPGLTNHFLSRYVKGVAVSFAESKPHFAKCPDVVHAGNPCASAVLRADRKQGFASLGLAPETPFVVVVGGSGGAKALNEAAVRMSPALSALPDVHVVIVTGERFYEETKARIEGLASSSQSRIHVLPYLHNMPEVLAAASLVVSRAGASLVAEITAIGVPSILVPSPNVTNNHQEPNARSVADAGAGEMILERELTGDALFERISAIMGDSDRRAAMSKASRSLGMPEAAAAIYEQIRRVTRQQR